MNKIILLLLICFITVFGFVVYVEMNSELEQEIVEKEKVEEEDKTLVTEFVDEVEIANSYMDELKDPKLLKNTNFFKEMFAEKEKRLSNNEELQRYVKGQTTIEGNHITISADKKNREYYSGIIESIVSFRYGTYRFKIKNIIGNGLFPAIWLVPNGLTSYPEVDIYEHIGNEPKTISGVMHNEINHKYYREYFVHDFTGDVPSEYEVGLTWTKQRLAWYVNGEVVLEITENVPDIPLIMIMNLAVGGIWPKNPTSDVEFPAYFDIEVLEFNPEEIIRR